MFWPAYQRRDLVPEKYFGERKDEAHVAREQDGNGHEGAPNGDHHRAVGRLERAGYRPVDRFNRVLADRELLVRPPTRCPMVHSAS